MSTPVTLRGRLGGDPELRFSAQGKPVASFSLVTSRRVKDDQSGEWRDADTTWWNCVAFGQMAENIAESLTKGTAVIVTGNAYQEEWEDRSGAKRRSLKVTADDVAPSLRFASAKVSRAERKSGGQARGEDPWSGETGDGDPEPPFL